MFCNICAAKAVFDSQMDIIRQQWNSKTMSIDTKIKIKYTPHTWSIETCPHQGEKIDGRKN